MVGSIVIIIMSRMSILFEHTTASNQLMVSFILIHRMVGIMRLSRLGGCYWIDIIMIMIGMVLVLGERMIHLVLWK
jgi:hypothetical protein